MTDQEQERRFIENVRNTLDAAAGSIDGRTQARLSRARARAVDVAGGPRLRWLGWPAGAVLAVSILLVLMSWPGRKAEITSEARAFYELEIITGHEDLEFYRDLEFYYWLTQEEKHAS
jgi:hypothetical protein